LLTNITAAWLGETDDGNLKALLPPPLPEPDANVRKFLAGKQTKEL